MTTPALVLASGSAIRKQLLENAGVSVQTHPARVDEASVKLAMLEDEYRPRDIADALAELKAMRVSLKYAGQYVLGADQILVSEGRIFDKPESREEAAEQLKTLRGKTHELLSAAVIFRNGEPQWRHIGRAQMMMRPFTDAFIEEYLDQAGPDILDCVGAYQLEGIGAQLFTRVQGDYFSVLGLPLLEVLGFLRANGGLTE